ncbi:hard surface induced protein [Histoplasma capsulatum H143]|uniref:Hard surface induced protein n=1 Tax=Ajellomyces capsulatus (strain H143) TaxID=544712 RepID=C6H273_AJECH|nr:hard surface induced protein [Histoplasma capsulatum H143]
MEQPISPRKSLPSPLNESFGSSLEKHRKNHNNGWKHFNSDSKPDSHSNSESLSLEENVMKFVQSFSLAVTPSFVHHLVRPRSIQSQKLHTIAALDGLRGWACLLVFNFHFLFTYTHKTAIGWGFDEDNWGIHQLPIIHMLISGHVMVTIFFVISGYVLSYKPLRLLRTHSWEKAFHTLASSTFRRVLRLYIPSIAGIFCVLIAVRLGFYHYATWVRDEGHTILGTDEQHPPYFISFVEQFKDWYLTVAHLLDPWNWNTYYNFYNPHLWTIPVEFRCSLFLFLTIVCLSRFRAWIRLTLVSCLICYCIRWGRWDVVLFLSGMLMAEVDLIHGIWEEPRPTPLPSSPSIPLPHLHKHEYPRGNDNVIDHTRSSNTHDIENTQYPTPTMGNHSHHRQGSHRLLWLSVFTVGLFIGSSPNNSPQSTPFYRTLASTLTPSTYPEGHRFLQSLGAVIIVCSINHSPDLQKVFTNALAQYLGRISYAFYIVHGPILHSLGYSLMPNIWALTGKETNAQYCFGFAIGWLICLPVSIWAADMFWRGVDAPTVRFSRWVEKCFLVAGL